MSTVARKFVTEPKPAPGFPDKEQVMLLNDISWDDYVTIGRVFQDRPAIRLTYDDGRLEIMTTSPLHEKWKKRLSRVVEVLAEELGMAFETAGQMTFEREDLKKAFEGDDCFWFAHEPQVRGKPTWDAHLDPPPDLFLEIEVSRRAIKRMKL